MKHNPFARHPDPVLASVEAYWSPRHVVARLLARWDGWATSGDLADAYAAMVDEPVGPTGLLKAIARLVTAGHVERRAACGFAAVGTQFEYRLVRSVAPPKAWTDERRPCVNENARGTHGEATHGVRCDACHETHRAGRKAARAAVMATWPTSRAARRAA